MEIRCNGKIRINGIIQRCKKKLFISKGAMGIVEIKCPKCHRVQTINLEG